MGDWIKEGVHIVIPRHILNMLTWEEVEIRTAGDKIVDLEILKKNTVYQSCDENHRIAKMFKLRYPHKVCYTSYADPTSLPKSHTCFFQIDLPNYETEEIMKQKMAMAAEFCGEIDDD